MTANDPAGSTAPEQEPAASQPDEDPGYLTETGEAASEDGSVVPIIAEAPPRTVINCNVPNLPQAELRGLRLAHLSRAGLIRSALADADGPSVQLELGFSDSPPDDGSDESLSSAGFATLTPLLGVSEDTSGAAGAIVDQLIDAWVLHSGAGGSEDARRVAI